MFAERFMDMVKIKMKAHCQNLKREKKTEFDPVAVSGSNKAEYC
jgi:hypothetical protein